MLCYLRFLLDEVIGVLTAGSLKHYADHGNQPQGGSCRSVPACFVCILDPRCVVFPAIRSYELVQESKFLLSI